MMFSTPLTVTRSAVLAAEPKVIVNVSVPKPPSTVSPVLIVIRSAPVVAAVLGALIVSLPAEPTIASTPVVSDL